MGCKVEWTPYSVTVTGPKAWGGQLKAIDVNMNAMPDAAMTLAVAALFADGTTAIRDVYNWRVKETERMIAIVTELRKLGAEVEEGRDYCVITPPKVRRRRCPSLPSRSPDRPLGLATRALSLSSITAALRRWRVRTRCRVFVLTLLSTHGGVSSPCRMAS